MEFIIQRNFTFLAPSKVEMPIRERELEHAEIRAHAARFSHQRRAWLKLQQQLKQQDDEQHEDERRPSTNAGKYGIHGRPQSRELILLLHNFHGSSDPFNAYPVKITPEINRIIAYARDVMLPNVFSPPFFRRLTAGGPKLVNYERSDRVIGGSNFILNIQLFRDMSEGAALGWLCGHIPPIVRLNSPETTQTLSVARLKMRAKSIKLLREELKDHPESAPESLAALRLHIRTLYEAECMAGDTTAARAHMDILLRLEDPVTDERVRLQHLLVMMYNATELACKKLERTVMPFGAWTSERLATLWAISSTYIPVAPQRIQEAHASVTFPVLREAVVRLRYCVWIGETPLAFTDTQERLKADMVFAWTATKTFQDLGVLMNLYMDIVEGIVSFDSEGRRLVQACMVLTLLFMVRKCVHEAIIEDGTDVREASHILIPRLEQDMITAMEMMTPAEKIYYQEAFLWMLYAGALHEQRQKSRGKHSDARPNSPDPPWFMTTLARHARQMNVTTWEHAKSILQDFVHDRYLEPDGHLWFEEVLQIQNGPKRPQGSDVKPVSLPDQSPFGFLDFSGKSSVACAAGSSTNSSSRRIRKKDAAETVEANPSPVLSTSPNENAPKTAIRAPETECRRLLGT
ncbi:hypothetical protein PV04_02241 [Phialophora macrospora]|uniref:Uncharacterized protein n=1 Tax=Phialophora macrospora TaxID=1851006 RepID=A0A0D2CXP2_9EURO|nr:hypothetical protein PV04_02241 [Phialophora macrospora]